jgi:hypothetical protein
MYLTRIAGDFVKNHKKRCLLLTYNLALVSDIKRLTFFTDIPSNCEGPSFDVMGLHYFFRSIHKSMGVFDTKQNNYTSYDEFFKAMMNEMATYIKNGAITREDILSSLKSHNDIAEYDHIFIDEAQDWGHNEITVLYSIFGAHNIILGEGKDQLIRSDEIADWYSGVENHIEPRRQSIRQKANIVHFLNSYAEECELEWDVSASNDMPGGRIIITNKKYCKEMHEEYFNECEKAGNIAYDYMFLVPPSLARNKQFREKDRYEKMGIRLWDGTNEDIRRTFPVERDEHRVLQYDSCRGLEGWTVVCLAFDDFIRYKHATYKPGKKPQGLFATEEELRNKDAFRWSMIPMTRAKDTVIIMLDDMTKNEKFIRPLIETAKKFPDFVRAYEEKGMTPAEFDGYGATRRTLLQFLNGYTELVKTIRSIMIKDPDLKGE